MFRRSVLCAAKLATSRASLALPRTAMVPRMGVVALAQPMRFASNPALAEATLRELEDERSRSGKPERPTPPAGWEVVHTPGKSVFDMKKTYQDEDIVVSYCPSPEGESVNHHELLVLITSKGQTLQFDLSVEEGELVLDNICFYPDAKLAKDESVEADAKRKELYPGPKVGELDDGLLDTFIGYLNERGINDEVGEFVTLYSFWSEQQEYENWLQSINKFVS